MYNTGSDKEVIAIKSYKMWFGRHVESGAKFKRQRLLFIIKITLKNKMN